MPYSTTTSSASSRKAPTPIRPPRAPRSPGSARRCRRARSGPPSPTRPTPTGWRVNAWVKQGILLGFRFGGLADAVDGPRPLAVRRQGHAAAQDDHGRRRRARRARRIRRSATARSSAGASSACRRCTSTSARGSARGRSSTRTRWSGSCAQIGARVHLSAAAQIGGVIEPVGALPVIVEDDVLVGGNTGMYEGRGRQGAGRDRRRHGHHRLDAALRPAERRASSGPSRAAARGAGGRGRRSRRARRSRSARAPEWGLSLATPVIVKYRDARTDTRTELERWIR